LDVRELALFVAHGVQLFAGAAVHDGSLFLGHAQKLLARKWKDRSLFDSVGQRPTVYSTPRQNATED
jgi:hypothetical protein